MISQREELAPSSHSAAEPPVMLGSEYGTAPATKPVARLDAIGIWWITYGGIWTAMVIAGMIFLFIKRKSPAVRLRGLPLTFTGIIFLHLYWVAVQIGYTIGPMAPAVAEFWIMSIWYPFGIALFQAGNSQFLYVAKAQSRFAMPPSEMISRFDEKRMPKKQNFVARMLKLDQRRSRVRSVGEDRWWNFFLPNEYQARMFTFVAMGMTVQFFVVIIIFLMSRKFHSDFGIPGTEVYGSTAMDVAIQQGRGWEWWPSLFWQFLWSWVIAPIIIWRARRIRDTHGWQLQTIACCIAGLHAAPMWLIALYVPGMAPVNQCFIPPQWIALSISVMEIFTIFVPCYQVRKDAAFFKEALATREEWEKRHPHSGSFKFSYSGNPKSTSSFSSFSGTSTGAPRSSTIIPLSLTSTKVGSSITFMDPWKKSPVLESGTAVAAGGELQNGYDLSKLMNDDSILSRTALDLVLAKNPEPLRQFSARRDFSGENIAFLTAVSEWKSCLPLGFCNSRHASSSQQQQQQQQQRLNSTTTAATAAAAAAAATAAAAGASAAGAAVDPETKQVIYAHALRIYTEFISNQDAEFPINIGFEVRRALEGTFERAARKLLGDQEGGGGGDYSWTVASAAPSTYAPFDGASSLHTVSHHPKSTRSNSAGSETGIITAGKMTTTSCTEIELTATAPPFTGTGAASNTRNGSAAGDATLSATPKFDIPPSFDANVFEKAYEEIRYLVLTNTWPKYVREWRNSADGGSSVSSSSSSTSDGKGDSRLGEGSVVGSSNKTNNKRSGGTATSGTVVSDEGGGMWSVKAGVLGRMLGVKT